MLWAWLLLVVALASSVTLFFYRRWSVDEGAQRRFNRQTTGVTDAVVAELDSAEQLLLELRDEFDTDGRISIDAFDEFFRERPLASEQPNAQMLFVIEKVSAEDLEDFEQQEVRPQNPLGLDRLLPSQATYLIISRNAPASLRQVAIGLDIRFVGPASTTVVRAIETGETTLSESIPLSTILLAGEETEGEPQLVALAVPVYASESVPEATEGRDQLARGSITELIFVDRLIGRALGSGATIGVELFEGSEIDDSRVLTSLPASKESPDLSGLTAVETIDVFGQAWTFRFEALDGFTDPADSREPWLYLVGGLAVSFLLFALVYTLLRARGRALDMVDEATGSLRESEERYRQAFEDEKVIAERLKEADRLKSEFMAMVSHELRTPLTAAAAFVDTVLLQWERLSDDERRELLSRASGNARDLSRLIGQLLEFARLDNDQITVALQPANLSVLVDDMMRQVAPLIADHQTIVDVPDDCEVSVDPDAFGHVLSNLLTNAAKYSDGGTPITVDAAIRGREVVVSVTDQGQGIDPEDHERVFDRFHQAGGDGSARPGLGIGLAIVRRFVELQGGKVWVRSTLGEGSTFSFTLSLVGGDERLDVPTSPAATSH